MSNRDKKIISCSYCNGTGKFKMPNDENAFDKRFDHYADMGHFNMGEAREKALNEIGYTLIDCPNCSKPKP